MLDWGTLSTLSSLNPGFPFGNVYSFVDGSCVNSTGTPYFYGTFLDQSFIDMKSNPAASFTLSEASMSQCQRDAFVDKVCTISLMQGKYAIGGDPESPICARLTLTGTLELVDNGDDEYKFAHRSFLQRHPQMQSWPSDHNWKIAKLRIKEVWLIDFFGGATLLDPETYYSAELDAAGKENW